jgi:hypothetical protein
MKKLFVIFVFALLTACSSGPSDGDVRKIIEQGMSQIDAALTPIGLRMSDLFDIESKIVSKADKGGGQWVVQIEQSLVFKKSLDEFPQQQQLVLMSLFGQFQKGKKTPAQMTQATLIKGDKGWIATN